MKIAVFFDLPDGGARYAMYKILEKLSKNHVVDIYAYKNSKNITNFDKVCHKIFLSELLSFAKLNRHIARIAEDLYTIFAVPFVERRIAKLMNDSNYDLVLVNHTRHFQAPYILKYLSGKVMFLCHEPTRAFFETTLRPDKKLSWYNLIYEKAIRHIKKNIEISNAQYPKLVLANSKFSQKQIFRAYGIASHKLSMGVDTKEFFQEKISKVNEVLVVGNDEPQKNLKLAVDTIAMLPKLHRPLLHIVKPRSGELTKISQYALKQKVNIKISSQVDLCTLRQFYNQALCTLAVARREPFGLSVIESMACGTPVIAIKEGGYCETVKHGVSGYLARRDPVELAFYVRQARKIISQDCIDHVKQNFTWENAIKEILKLSV